MQTIRTSFASGKGQCTAWLTLPEGDGPFPAVLLIHGFGATHEMVLPNYERWFSQAGMAVVSFDFRYIGASPGQPRQRIRIRNMLADVNAAFDWTLSQAVIDSERVAVWGTSMGASHALVTAARRPEIAALVLNCPIIDTRNGARKLGLRHMARLFLPAVSDIARSWLGLRPHYVPLVADVGHFGVINTPGAYAGWYSLMPPGMQWDNRVGAAIALDMIAYRAVDYAPRVRCPLLVSVCQKEVGMDPDVSVQAAKLAPRGQEIRYIADHFEVYHPPMVQAIAADYIEFLQKHLAIGQKVDAKAITQELPPRAVGNATERGEFKHARERQGM